MADATHDRLLAPRVIGSYLARVAIVFAAQFAVGKLGDVFQSVRNGGIGPVWPASGIALGALLLYGYSVWPGVAAGAFLLTCLSPLSYRDAAIYAAGTTLAALLGAFLVRRVSRVNCALSGLRDVLALIVLGGFVSSLVSASIGTPILDAARLRGWSGFGSAWLIYWLGDSTGVILVTPVLLTFSQLVKLRHRGRLTELAILFLLLTVTCLVVLGELPSIPVRLVAFVVLPFVMWAAIRFGIGATALSILLIAAIATVETEWGSGPFASNTPFLNAVLLDVFFVVLSASGLTLAAAMAERDQAERQRERLAREQAAMEVRLRLASIVESSDDAIIGADMNGVVTDWNKGAERLFGYSAPEAIGKHISFLAGADHPEEAQGILQTVTNGKLVKNYETVRQRKDGTEVDIALTVSPIFDAKGRIVGASGIARDMSERKRAVRESEQRFRLVANTAPVMIWMSGLDKLCNYFNQRWIEFTGRSIEAELGNGWAEGVHREDLTSCLDTYVQAFDRREPFKMQYRLRRNDGNYRWVLDTGVPRFDPDGSFLGYIGSCIDITDHKSAEEALSNVSRRLIEAHEEERTRIARELHDDINQRIATLAIEVGQIDQDPSGSNGELRRCIQEIQRNLWDLGSDVQVLSHRLHSSKLEYLGLTAAARSFCEEFSQQRKVEIEFSSKNIPRHLPREAALCLFRVLQEALQNAVRHGAAKQITVELRGTPDEIQLSVTDSGVGFDPELAMRGRGIGIISMQERLHLVNGTLSIDTKPKGGTMVRACVPYSLESASMGAAG